MKPLHEDILTLHSSVSMPLMILPVTSIALRTSRGVVLVSPGKQIPEQEASLRSFGRVTDIVAPNLLHHVSIHLARKTFPEATLWGVEGFRKKRPDVAWDKILDAKSWNYSDEIQVFPLAGAPNINECVFLHLKSKTLVVTDLFFNLLDAKGIGAWMILKMFGTYRRFGISSFYLRYVKDLEAFKNSLKIIAACDFESIVMTHGAPVLENAKAVFTSALKERNLL